MKKLLSNEIIAYLFWGGMTTVVSWGSYAIFSLVLDGLFAEEITITIANILSWICAVAFAFVTNKIWVFNSRSWEAGIWWPELVKFVLARLATGVLEMVAVPLAHIAGLDFPVFGVKGMGAKIIISIIVVILNYVFSKFLVFDKKEK